MANPVLMSGTCKDCFHWMPWSGGYVGYCDVAHSSANRPIHTETKAFAMSDSGEPAVLKTRHSFGCNQFKARD